MYGCKLNAIANGVKRIVNFNQFDHGIPAMDVGKLNGSKQICYRIYVKAVHLREVIRH